MQNPRNKCLWLLERDLQDRIKELSIEQEIYSAQHAHKSWIQFDDKNTKYFQMVATIGKRHNSIRRLKDKRNWFLQLLRTKMELYRFLLLSFAGDLKRTQRLIST